MITLRPQVGLQIKKELEIARLRDFSNLLNFDALPGTFREKIMAVEAQLLLIPEVVMEYDHSFHGGVYLRTLYAPKGTLMTSYIYRVPQQNLISKGVVSYRSEVLGGKITGPAKFSADAGSKRVVYCHTDMVWTTIVKTDCTTVEDVEREIYLDTYEEWDQECCANIIEVGG